MPTPAALLQSIQSTPTGLTLSELLVLHPTLARRTVQRKIGQWIAARQIVAQGEGRARRYLATTAAPRVTSTTASGAPVHTFPAHIPLSADSQDILAYVTQPDARTSGHLQPRHPQPPADRSVVGFQPPGGQHLFAPGHGGINRTRAQRHRQGRDRDANDLEPQERHRTAG